MSDHPTAVAGCARLALSALWVRPLVAPVTGRQVAARLREHTDSCGCSLSTGGMVMLDRKGGHWTDLNGTTIPVTWAEIGDHLAPALTADRLAAAVRICDAWGTANREHRPGLTSKLHRAFTLWTADVCHAALRPEPAQGVLL